MQYSQTGTALSSRLFVQGEAANVTPRGRVCICMHEEASGGVRTPEELVFKLFQLAQDKTPISTFCALIGGDGIN